jgi:hypothetical protein
LEAPGTSPSLKTCLYLFRAANCKRIHVFDHHDCGAALLLHLRSNCIRVSPCKSSAEMTAAKTHAKCIPRELVFTRPCVP